MTPLSVSELSAHIKALLDADPTLAEVWVEGEVSNCRPAASGHWYFSLKDEGATIACVIWKGVAFAMAHLPEEGRRFLMHGAVSAYAAQGRYQFYVDRCEPAGLGDLHRRFELLKAKLDAEGLFDPERKRPLPRYPARIGIVTSPQAAAFRDVCHVLERRWPTVEVILAPTLVQGDSAPAQIVAAIEAIGRAGVDLVIVTRGGGSIEDLWAFNDEGVARAIAACPVPVIAGVGHEIDFTIADFVADLRAPTPSAAAELATPDARELRLAVDDRRDRMAALAGGRLMDARGGVDRLAHRLRLATPHRTVQGARERVAEHRERLARSLTSRLRLSSAGVDGARGRLDALSPQATLARGYAHVTRARDGGTVRSKKDVGSGTGLRIRVADGAFGAVVEGQQTLFDEGEH
jgi:exodeoxyribonuclease VII large subunit